MSKRYEDLVNLAIAGFLIGYIFDNWKLLETLYTRYV